LKIPKLRNATCLGVNFRISKFRHFACREVEEATIFGNREFQTPGSQKAERSRVIGSWRISAVDHVGGEVFGIQRLEFFEVRNLSVVDLASREIPKNEKKNSRKY
jgi:hypothetical protein